MKKNESVQINLTLIQHNVSGKQAFINMRADLSAAQTNTYTV